jgi:hypothetical protein
MLTSGAQGTVIGQQAVAASMEPCKHTAVAYLQGIGVGKVQSPAAERPQRRGKLGAGGRAGSNSSIEATVVWRQQQYPRLGSPQRGRCRHCSSPEHQQPADVSPCSTETHCVITIRYSTIHDGGTSLGNLRVALACELCRLIPYSLVPYPSYTLGN